MQNFSTIAEKTVPEKEAIIQQYVAETGLPEETVTQLFESFSFSTGGTISAIKNKFEDLVSSVDNNPSFRSLVDKINNLFKFTSKNRNSLILDLVNQQTNNTTALIKIICFILLIKNRGQFAEICEGLNIDFGLIDLMESNQGFDNLDIDEGIKSGMLSSEAIEEEYEFYMGLRTILARNNKRWGYNYRLDNTWEEISKFIDSKSRELSKAGKVQSHSEDIGNKLLRNMVVGKLDHIEKSSQFVNTNFPDKQQLLFDIFVVLTSYVKLNREPIKFVSGKTYEEWLHASANLYKVISSSYDATKIVDKTKTRELYDKDIYADIQNVNDIELNYRYFGIDHANEQTLKFQNMMDGLYIIKGMTQHFNLNIRPVIRMYLQKTTNLIVSTNRAISRIRHNRLQNGNI